MVGVEGRRRRAGRDSLKCGMGGIDHACVAFVCVYASKYLQWTQPASDADVCSGEIIQKASH
jgi:hypothetical protein